MVAKHVDLKATCTKGVTQICQHYQELTQSTLLCDPIPPTKRVL